MCGIFGEFSNTLIDREHFLKLNSLSRNRGPDMEGYWSDNTLCQLGFNRLSIIDLSRDGNQPMISSNKKWVMVMNGEVYNFQDIIEKLGKTNKDFKSSTDTEVVLAAFEIWGISKTLKNINGIYSIALYDIYNREIHLIRDIAGVKPLYYGLMNNCLVFASQYDQIFNHPNFKKQLIVKDSSLADFIRMGYITAPNAFFKHTWQVNPGEIVTINREMGIKKIQYYSYSEFQNIYKETDQKSIIKLDSILSKVVKNQLISDVPIGALLSGGIDSPLICNYISKENQNLEVFTIGSKDIQFDESKAALEYAKYLGAKTNLYNYSNKDIYRDLNNHFRAYSEPFGDYSSLLSFQVCKNVKSKFNVVLGGDGGDELFWGYPRFDRFISHRNWFKIPSRNLLAAIIRKLGFQISYGISSKSIQEWAFIHHSQNNMEIINKILPGKVNSQDLIKIYNDKNKLQDRKEILFWLRKNEFYGHMQRVLLKMDRASMYHGLEYRVPFLDRKVLEFSKNIEPELSYKHRSPKYMLKDLMKKKYPQKIIQNEKKGFSFNLDYSLRNILKDEVMSLLVDQDPYPYNTFDRIELNKYVNGFYKNESHNVWGIWILYALQKWSNIFLK
tara:strand:+ start:12329 stop:14167 length:1839 start_codon:yes stop_codon:yes gene_type:complete